MDTKICQECEKGVLFVANGFDDVEAVWCSCDEGRVAMRWAEIAELKSQLVKKFSYA